MLKYLLLVLFVMVGCSPNSAPTQSAQTQDTAFAKNGEPFIVDSVSAWNYATKNIYANVHDVNGFYVVGMTFFAEPVIGTDSNEYVSFRYKDQTGTILETHKAIMTVSSLNPIRFTFIAVMSQAITLTGRL